MGNLIKLNTTFQYPAGHINEADTPAIAQKNAVINTTTGQIYTNINGFVILDNMTDAQFVTKNDYYVFGYGVYTGQKTDTPSNENFDSFVFIDAIGGEPQYEERFLSATAPNGKFLVPLLIKKNEAQVGANETIDDMVEM